MNYKDYWEDLEDLEKEMRMRSRGLIKCTRCGRWRPPAVNCVGTIFWGLCQECFDEIYGSCDEEEDE